MSLNVSGIIAIVSIPQRIELKNKNNVMYTFDAIAADRYEKKKRHKYKMCVIIPSTQEGVAITELEKNNIFQIHSGRWVAEEKDFGEKKVIYNKLYVYWIDLLYLNWAGKKKGDTNGKQASN